MKPLKKVNVRWSPEFAYAIGLLTTDGNLSPDGRHMTLTSKDREMLETFKKCLNLTNIIGKKARGASPEIKKYYVIQFGDVVFYRFLLGLGLHPNKSKTLASLRIPGKYLFDFIRGHFDGDGTFYSYWDPRWKSSFMFYTVFMSASKPHVLWIREILQEALHIKGHVTTAGSIFQLKYAKGESLKLLPKLYYNEHVHCLERKRKKIERIVQLP